jgi:hypothetical protein
LHSQVFSRQLDPKRKRLFFPTLTKINSESLSNQDEIQYGS